jgi:hypothetical protein
MNSWDSSFITYRNSLQTKFLNNRLQRYAVDNGCTSRIIIENGSGAVKEASNVSELAIGEALTTLSMLESTLENSTCIVDTIPDAPIDVSATAGNGQATISFTAPANNGGTDITSYTVTSSPGNITVSGASSPITVTGLTNGTSYTFTVIATNSVGDSVASSSSSAVTPFTIPAAPTSLLLSSSTSSSVTITFTAGNNGGSTITNYKYSTNNGTTYTVFSPADTSSPVTISGLSSSTTYQIKLRAINAAGDGAESTALTVTTASAISAPNPPTALSGVGGDNAIYVLFTAGSNGGSPITNYEYSIDGGESFTPFSPEQTTSPVTITGVTNGISYDIQLKAVNSIGSSEASSTATVTPTVNTLLSSNRIIHLDANNSSSYSGSGSTWTNLDSAGSYSASLLNAPTFDAVNKVFTFDGTNQVAQIAQAAAINPTAGSPITVQVWAKVNTSSPNFASGDGLISKQFWTPSYDGYSLSLNTDTSLYLKMNGTTVDGTYSSATGAYNDQWALYTIVVRFGGGSSNPSYTYVSTRRVATGNNNDISIPSNTAPLEFPRGIQSGGNYCPADIGAFYYYNTALSHEDIIRNYDATKSRY